MSASAESFSPAVIVELPRTVQIEAHVRIKGGKLLSNANAHRIVARSLRPTDKMGNRLPSPFLRDAAPPYFQTWRIQKESKGYCFREVNHGAGISGCHKSVRALVISTLCCGLFGPREDIVVEVLP